MLRFLKGFFGKPTPPDVTPKPEPVAPYKVEAPVTPAVVNPEVFPHVFVDGHGDVQEAKAKPKKAPAKKKPAAIKAAPKARTPRKPKTK